MTLISRRPAPTRWHTVFNLPPLSLLKILYVLFSSESWLSVKLRCLLKVNCFIMQKILEFSSLLMLGVSLYILKLSIGQKKWHSKTESNIPRRNILLHSTEESLSLSENRGGSQYSCWKSEEPNQWQWLIDSFPSALLIHPPDNICSWGKPSVTCSQPGRNAKLGLLIHSLVSDYVRASQCPSSFFRKRLPTGHLLLRVHRRLAECWAQHEQLGKKPMVWWGWGWK